MSLYGRTDSNANVTKASRGIAASSQAKTIVFVDETEAALKENKDRGINAPGWWSYYTYTDSSGATRHKAEHLVTLANADLNANETQSDDTIAADLTIVIDSQPADASVTAPAAAQFVVAATTTPAGGTLTFQWQEDQGSGFANLSDGGVYSGATTNTLDISDSTGLNGYQYRLAISATGASAQALSDAATLTVA
jgi:hypothetical protein